MENILKEGCKLYAVEDGENGTPGFIEAEVSEVLPKLIQLKEGDKLFGVNRVSKSDPRISPFKMKAIKSYISRKKRQVRDLNDKKRVRNYQLKVAKLLLAEVKRLEGFPK